MVTTAHKRLAFYADSFGLIELGRTVAVEYGRLRAATEALGRPVPSNDLWIAASATANGLPLVTLNRRHFEPLTLHGLRLLWSQPAAGTSRSRTRTASGSAGRRIQVWT